MASLSTSCITELDVSIECALFSNLYGHNAVLIKLGDLSSGVPSFLKSDNGKLLRIAIEPI